MIPFMKEIKIVPYPFDSCESGFIVLRRKYVDFSSFLHVHVKTSAGCLGFERIRKTIRVEIF